MLNQIMAQASHFPHMPKSYAFILLLTYVSYPYKLWFIRGKLFDRRRRNLDIWINYWWN